MLFSGLQRQIAGVGIVGMKLIVIVERDDLCFLRLPSSASASDQGWGAASWAYAQSPIPARHPQLPSTTSTLRKSL